MKVTLVSFALVVIVIIVKEVELAQIRRGRVGYPVGKPGSRFGKNRLRYPGRNKPRIRKPGVSGHGTSTSNRKPKKHGGKAKHEGGKHIQSKPEEPHKVESGTTSTKPDETTGTGMNNNGMGNMGMMPGGMMGGYGMMDMGMDKDCSNSFKGERTCHQVVTMGTAAKVKKLSQKRETKKEKVLRTTKKEEKSEKEGEEGKEDAKEVEKKGALLCTLSYLQKSQNTTINLEKIVLTTVKRKKKSPRIKAEVLQRTKKKKRQKKTLEMEKNLKLIKAEGEPENNEKEKREDPFRRKTEQAPRKMASRPHWIHSFNVVIYYECIPFHGCSD
ncbi:hypothetical protein MTO96_034233 [Rhipicephalus appendiculatus]